MGCLYQIVFPSGKRYIGITAHSAEKRFAEHCYEATKNNDRALKRALRKYVNECVKLETLVIADDWDYLVQLERNAIRVFGTFGRGGYNMTAGGDGAMGYRHTPESLRKMGDVHRGKAHHNIPHSAESKAKMSASKKGRALSESHRNNIAKALVGNSYCAGYKHSKETIEKMSRAHLGKVFSESHLRNIKVAALLREEKRRQQRGK